MKIRGYKHDYIINKLVIDDFMNKKLEELLYPKYA